MVRRLSNRVLNMLLFLCAIRLCETQHKKDIKTKRHETEHRSGYIGLPHVTRKAEVHKSEPKCETEITPVPAYAQNFRRLDWTR